MPQSPLPCPGFQLHSTTEDASHFVSMQWTFLTQLSTISSHKQVPTEKNPQKPPVLLRVKLQFNQEGNELFSVLSLLTNNIY